MSNAQAMSPTKSKRFRTFIVVLCLACFSTLQTHAQQLEFSFKGFGINDGLPSEQIYNMVQDDFGLLWLSTDNGISSYDGRNFENHDLTSIVGSNHVLHLYKQKDGTILGATIDGKLFTLNPLDQSITPFRYNEVLVEEIQDRIISSVYCAGGAYYFSFLSHTGYTKMDSNGTAESWLIENRGNSSFLLVNAIKPEGNSVEDFTLPAYPEHVDRLKEDGFDIRTTSMTNDFFQRSKRNEDETVFAFLHLGVLAYNSPQTEWRVEVNALPFCCGFYQNWVWVGMENKGLRLYSKYGKLVSHVLRDKSVSDMYIDHQGGMWVSTLYSGVFYASSPLVSKISLPIENPDRIYDLTATPDGHLFLGFNDGRVLQFDSAMTSPDSVGFNYRMHSIIGYSKHFADFVHVERLGKSESFSLLVGGKRIKIYGDSVESKLRGISSFSTMDSRAELLAVGGWGLFQIHKNGHVRYLETSIRPNDAIRCPKGYYIASNQGVRFVSESGRLETLNTANQLLNQPVYQLTKLGDYYVGSTSGRGLIFFNQDTVFQLRSKNALTHSKINHLYSRTPDTLWVCSNSGIYQIFLTKNQDISVRDLRLIRGGSILHCKDIAISKGRIWIITPSGLHTISRSSLTHNSSQEIHFQPISAHVNGEPIAIEKLNELKHNENNIEISYRAISFSQVLKFRYKLVGFDNDWHHTNGFKLNYSSIPPGEYQLVVQAQLGTGRLLKSDIEIPISVIPPIYSRLWFKSLILIAIVALVYLFFRLRILNYNYDIIREILRQLLKKIRTDQHLIVFRDQGKNVQVRSEDVLYVKASNNNVDIYTKEAQYSPRMRLSDFQKIVPDNLEYLQIHRSYIVRLDNITEHDSSSVIIGSTQIPIGQNYKRLFMELKPPKFKN